jgi:hypothetical protein
MSSSPLRARSTSFENSTASMALEAAIIVKTVQQSTRNRSLKEVVKQGTDNKITSNRLGSQP